MKGTDRITACMPIPKAAGDPLEWGIITSPLPQVEGNKTIQCKEGWDSAWTVSLLQKFQYGGNTSWCIKWQGKQNGTDELYTVSRVDSSGKQEPTKLAW